LRAAAYVIAFMGTPLNGRLVQLCYSGISTLERLINFCQGRNAKHQSFSYGQSL
jgi:hypothetical protein